MSDNNTTEVTRDVVQHGLWSEEYEIGTCYLHRPGCTVTGIDGVLLTTLTMNTQPLHLDTHWSSQQPGLEGGRLVSSMWTLSTVVGLSVRQSMLGTIIANLGFTEVAFPTPMSYGDTLYTETTCHNERLPKPRPNQGIVEPEHIGRNQDSIIVYRAVRSVLAQRMSTSLDNGSENVASAGK